MRFLELAGGVSAGMILMVIGVAWVVGVAYQLATWLWPLDPTRPHRGRDLAGVTLRVARWGLPPAMRRAAYPPPPSPAAPTRQVEQMDRAEWQSEQRSSSPRRRLGGTTGRLRKWTRGEGTPLR